MPLPIPDILERASKVLENAKVVCSFLESAGEMIPNNDLYIRLRESLKKVSPDDLIAVLNEVGKVYVGMHNIQILKIGSRPNPQAKSLEFAIEIDFGLGPRTLLTQIPLEGATHLVKGFNDNLVLAATGTPVAGGLILDARQANGKP